MRTFDYNEFFDISEKIARQLISIPFGDRDEDTMHLEYLAMMSFALSLWHILDDEEIEEDFNEEGEYK